MTYIKIIKRGNLLIMCLLLFAGSFAQQTGDSKIISKVSDTSDIYIKVKRALIKNGFTVKDDMDSLTLTTNLAVDPFLGYTIIKASITNDTVALRGFYCNKKFDLKGTVYEPKGFYRILYFKGGNGWLLLKHIAMDIDPHDISFSK